MDVRHEIAKQFESVSARQMTQAIEEGCERVDGGEW